MANSDKKHEPESDLKRQIQNKKQSFQQEQKVANHIAYWIVGILVILLLILGVQAIILYKNLCNLLIAPIIKKSK